MTKTITWGPELEHDGSDKCPVYARDVPCMICGPIYSVWFGEDGGTTGTEWGTWQHVTAYRLPIPADSVRDALVEALRNARDWFRACCVDQSAHGLCNQLDAALALAKGEKP